MSALYFLLMTHLTEKKFPFRDTDWKFVVGMPVQTPEGPGEVTRRLKHPSLTYYTPDGAEARQYMVRTGASCKVFSENELSSSYFKQASNIVPNILSLAKGANQRQWLEELFSEEGCLNPAFRYGKKWAYSTQNSFHKLLKRLRDSGCNIRREPGPKGGEYSAKYWAEAPEKNYFKLSYGFIVKKAEDEEKGSLSNCKEVKIMDLGVGDIIVGFEAGLDRYAYELQVEKIYSNPITDRIYINFKYVWIAPDIRGNIVGADFSNSYTKRQTFYQLVSKEYFKSSSDGFSQGTAVVTGKDLQVGDIIAAPSVLWEVTEVTETHIKCKIIETNFNDPDWPVGKEVVSSVEGGLTRRNISKIITGEEEQYFKLSAAALEIGDRVNSKDYGTGKIVDIIFPPDHYSEYKYLIIVLLDKKNGYSILSDWIDTTKYKQMFTEEEFDRLSNERAADLTLIEPEYFKASQISIPAKILKTPSEMAVGFKDKGPFQSYYNTTALVFQNGGSYTMVDVSVPLVRIDLDQQGNVLAAEEMKPGVYSYKTTPGTESVIEMSPVLFEKIENCNAIEVGEGELLCLR